MTRISVSSRNNPLIRGIRNLHLRGERERRGCYYVEGLRFVAQALRNNAQIEALVVCPSLLRHALAHRLVRRHELSGGRVVEVTAAVLQSISQVDDPQGIGAVVRQKWLPLERVKLGGKLCWLAHDVVQSPGNLGAIVRTSDAVGGAGLILLGDDIDPYDPATVRASMGSMFTQRFVRTSVRELVAWKNARQWMLVGTSPAATTDYRAVRYDVPTILMLGGERKGLSDEVQGLCDVVVRIPMVGRSDSLNVAVAAGVLLYEVFNQRRGSTPGLDSDHM